MKKISTMQAFSNELLKEQKLTIGVDLGGQILSETLTEVLKNTPILNSSNSMMSHRKPCETFCCDTKQGS